MIRFLVALFAATLALSAPASAHYRGGVSFGFSFPLYVGPPAYYYPAYPPPMYVAPRAYYPPPIYVAPPPPRVVYREQCREFRGDATIDASGNPFHGVACLRADGLWHIVN
ncbi:MAG: hypothetical protein FJX67_08525 [Alphaproteobacteria bacterium]|nr:hypothetical protein [Alphaproteobacteria bacterium]